jgi:hypothetical protein
MGGFCKIMQEVFNTILPPSRAKPLPSSASMLQSPPPPQAKEEYNSAAFGRADVMCSLQSHMATNLETSLVSVSAAVVVVVVVVFSLFFESEGMNYHDNIAACCCLLLLLP